jgi:hypothetical protein
MTKFQLCPFRVKKFYYTKEYRQEFCCILELNRDLLKNEQLAFLEKKNIIKLLNKNYDNLIFRNSKIIKRKLLFLPYMIYRLLHK